MELSCTFHVTDAVSVCAVARGWTGSPSASPSSRASAAAGAWNLGALRCFHPVSNYSPWPGTCSNKRSTTIRPRQASGWSWCCHAVVSGIPSVSELQSLIQIQNVRNGNQSPSERALICRGHRSKVKKEYQECIKPFEIFPKAKYTE